MTNFAMRYCVHTRFYFTLPIYPNNDEILYYAAFGTRLSGGES